MFGQVLCHVSCHFVINPQLLSSKDFSYNLILKPFDFEICSFYDIRMSDLSFISKTVDKRHVYFPFRLYNHTQL